MFKKSTGIFVMLLLQVTALPSQKIKTFSLSSPDNKININITIGANLQWNVKHGTDNIIIPSSINMKLQTGETLGENVIVTAAKRLTINKTINAVAYKKHAINDNYNELTLTFKGGYGVIFRAYNEAAAYRLFTKKKDDVIVQSEKAEFNFEKDDTVFIPHTSDLRGGDKYSCSFEEFYTEIPVSHLNKDTLAFLPLLVKLDNNKKAVILEADAQDYPGMFVQLNQQSAFGINAAFASYTLEEKLGGHSLFNYLATKRADYIARVKGTRTFPWRIVVVSSEDKELLNNDILQKLSEPCKIENTSWIQPGKVAWDWWNNWNVSHVDFRAGINTPTYKYYIDFAEANKLEYIILDEGWSDVHDLNKLNSAVNIKELIDYGNQKNVGLILWSTWYALSRDIEGLCKKYSEMGIKGFKVDFIDRNDQKMIASCYQMASVAAKYHLMLDFHGMFPPQGLMRTWPNVINFEAVRGMEYSKWSADERVPRFEVSLPFIRMIAGPMDYTPGAMRNATKGNARPSNSNPMSQGTRCRQLAMYVVYEAPLQMLADNPTIYMKEQECTDFIAKIPTVFDETTALGGKVGEYAAIARKKNDTWYIGAMDNWDNRDITIDLSFLGAGKFEAEVFKDGINADREATDYKREIIKVSSNDKLNVHLSSGGGWAARIYPAK